ncbi:DUF2225 domain-containing protein [Ureibacillus manganicus]|uniref:DUF2225 domain-containing protein n=1 Tax=Ureibacillus manganicus DSM 26584 TaxID=1384049 RepID=A0A0A3I3R1_9BACL|nr:DUF2225 domain-containing protein [Ureibacillus manganicus]KGR78155.1 hypothetical protein CD29_12065 [Ureibacillus manganicus DSM 26584]
MEITPFYEKQIVCINCNKKFPSNKVRTKFIKIDHTESDFRPIYSDSKVNALFYNVFVCEHCGFSFTEDFTKYFAPGVREVIQEQITKKWIQHNFNGERTISQAIQAFKLALLSGTFKKEKFVSLAGIALRLAWMYRSLENEDQEMRFMKMARDYYIESFSVEDYEGTQMSSVRIMYMIAELSRRINDLENATRFFSKVIEKQSIGGEAKLIDMAKDQWQLVREERERLREEV